MSNSNIQFHTQDIQFELRNKKKIRAWINSIICSLDKEPGDINYIFCSDEYLLAMNREHLNHDYYTDIITFDYCENKTVSGDLFISIDRTRENAKNFKTSHVNELHRVMAHGVLHLIGFKDKSAKDAAKMQEMEDYSLNLRSF